MTQYHVVTVQTVEAKGTFINDVIMSYHQGPAKGEQLSDIMKRDESKGAILHDVIYELSQVVL